MAKANSVIEEKEYGELMKLAKDYLHEADIKLISKAWEFAKLSHTGQKRLSGEPYTVHVLKTAKYLASWKLDKNSVIAGLLHETVEDGGAIRSDLLNEFGEDVTALIDGVSKISYIRLRGSTNIEFVENLRKMFLSMAKDLRVVIIKLADRLHNMETLSALPQDKQVKIARETLEIFSPLAERLGMGKLKGKLDDLAFPYVYPDEYKRVLEESLSHYKEAELHSKRMVHALHKSLVKEAIRAHIQARSKHLYSLWRKLERADIKWDFNRMHDIVALRVIVDTVPQCYTALGIVHSLFKPVPYIGISDYIAQPKPNGYRSIHTKVFGPGQRIVEVQIRTVDMHQEAEFGVAAHWEMSDRKNAGGITSEDLDKGLKVPQGKLAWVKQLAEWQKEITDSKEFLEAVKFDALSERNYVFSPNGDVYELPVNATPIDFAFAVHTGLGRFIGSAKVNGRIVPLNYKLKSGDVVEIHKTKNARQPTSDWLDHVVTNTARREINKYLRNTGN